MNTAPDLPAVHVCIATGQNAANLVPLLQCAAREIWVLQTPAMQASAAHLALALRGDDRRIERKPFDDSSPAALTRSSEAIAEQLDGRHVILHVTGGTKLMALALRDGLRLVEAGAGQLDVLYADTARQQIDWLAAQPRTEPMQDVLDLRLMLLVQGYRIEGDNRHANAQQRAAQPERARLTRLLGDNAARYRSFLSALATLGNRAAEDTAGSSTLTQYLQFSPGGEAERLLREASKSGLLAWDGDVSVTFGSTEAARYFAGGWIEEFVLLKLSGMARPGYFSSNLRVLSAENRVPNEIDAMLVHRNRALLIECKSGRQHAARDALYKLAHLRDLLGGSVASALYLTAQPLPDEHLQRAQEYRIDVLAGEQVGEFVSWLRGWMGR